MCKHPMTQGRIDYLRGELMAERISYGELAEIESAFEQLDPDTLRDRPENATASDMLDELEDYDHEVRRLRGECVVCRNLPTEGGDE